MLTTKRASFKTHGKWLLVLSIFFGLFIIWTLYNEKKHAYSELHRRVKCLESINCIDPTECRPSLGMQCQSD